MWLRFLYHLGLTNLSDDQVSDYEKYKSQRPTKRPQNGVAAIITALMVGITGFFTSLWNTRKSRFEIALLNAIKDESAFRDQVLLALINDDTIKKIRLHGEFVCSEDINNLKEDINNLKEEIGKLYIEMAGLLKRLPPDKKEVEKGFGPLRSAFINIKYKEG